MINLRHSMLGVVITYIILTYAITYAATIVLDSTFYVEGHNVFIDHSLFLAVFLLVSYSIKLHEKKYSAVNDFDNLFSELGDHVWHLILTCAVGVALSLWAKYLTVQIRPIVCLSEVRFAWIEVGDEQRSTLHQVVSFSGNAIASLLFPLIAFFNYGIQSARIKLTKNTVLQLAAIIALMVVFSGSFASRNMLFAFATVAFGSAVIVLFSNPTKSQMVKTTLSAFLIALVAFFSVFFITNNRIFCKFEESHVETIEDKSLNYVQAYEDEIPFQLPEEAKLAQSCPECAIIVLYLSHGVKNHENIFKNNLVGKNYLMNFVVKKLGLILPLKNVELTRYFRAGLTMVGAVRHDFGRLGIVCFACVVSFLLAMILKGLSVSEPSIKLISLAAFFVYLYSISTSLMFFPIMTMPFQFLLFGFFTSSLFALVGKKIT